LARSNASIAQEDKESLFELFSKNFDVFKRERERINYLRIVNIAYEIIINQNCNALPLDPLEFKIDSVIIMSFQDYAAKTGIDINTLTRNGKFVDGYTFSQNGLNVIFYNKDTYEPRARFTLFHEIGHIVLKHDKQSDKNEAEANFFAAQCIIPNALLKEIINRGYSVTKEMITQTFNVSEQVALNRLNYLKEFPDFHKNEYDDILIALFAEYLNSKFPNKKTYDSCDALDDEEKRSKWR
jgi:Zn-dependent peptidase ImmA (M78 family)